MALEKVRKSFYIVSILAALFAGYLSFNTEYGKGVTIYDVDAETPTYPVDSGSDGGAAGFAVLSGLSLVAASITYLKED
jgi:hypothetical protein